MTTYSVDLSEGITESFFTELERLAGTNLRVRKRLTEVTIELFQNIRKHAIRANHSTLILQKENSIYTVVSVNTVTANDVIFLQDKINYINTLGYTQRKDQHTHMLRKAVLSKKSGAGLGLYRISIRSASALTASFTKIDQHFFTFSLHVTLTA